MINEFKKRSHFLVFCEFHDDMTKVSDMQNPQCAEFFQIKTTAQYNKWTLSHLTKTTTKKSGEIKNSFLGFLFYNFMKFKGECSKCHFVSNIGMDADIKKWQSIIEDDKELKIIDNVLYLKIKGLIKKEFENIELNEFDSTFDKFIQDTNVYDGDLPLENYEKVVAGDFFKMLENDELFTSNSNKILRDIIEDVRKKSKTKIEVPISYSKLIEKKGVSSEVFSTLLTNVKNISSQSRFNELEVFLTDYGLSIPKRRLLLRELKQHKLRMLDINKLLYQDISHQIVELIDQVLKKHYARIDDISYLLNEINIECETIIRNNDSFNIPLVEAIFYERLISEDTTI